MPTALPTTPEPVYGSPASSRRPWIVPSSPCVPWIAQTTASSGTLRGPFAFIVSVRQTAVPLGGLLAGLLVPALVLRLGWQATGATLGLGSAIGGLVLALALPAVRREQPGGRA